MMASRPLGTMFQVTGTAATQYVAHGGRRGRGEGQRRRPDRQRGHDRGRTAHRTVSFCLVHAGAPEVIGPDDGTTGAQHARPRRGRDLAEASCRPAASGS